MIAKVQLGHLLRGELGQGEVAVGLGVDVEAIRKLNRRLARIERIRQAVERTPTGDGVKKRSRAAVGHRNEKRERRVRMHRREDSEPESW